MVEQAAVEDNNNNRNNNNNDDEQRRREEEMERLLLEQEQNQDNDNNEEGRRDGVIEPNNQEEEDILQQQQQQQQQIPLPPPPIVQQKSSGGLLSYRPLSFILFFLLIYYAFRTRKQYYLAVVYLSSSKWSYVIIGNAILALSVTLFDIIIKMFLNGLRHHEAEGLNDFFRWSITESCLALTMFRNELTIITALEFIILIVMKCLHHVAAQREQHLRLTEETVDEYHMLLIKRNHGKLLLFFILLQFIDLYCLQRTIIDLIDNGPSVKILFAFESAIMLISAWSHILLWYIHFIDSIISYGHDHEWYIACHILHPWKEIKATLTFAVELQAQAVQFLFYTTFFAIVLTYYGMPINLFREVYISFIQLKERLTAFYKYRNLMASMNRFDSATDNELDDAGRTCIICRDEMNINDCKKLPGCAHIFHKSCLREWLVQQQSCPTCRSDISTTRIDTAEAAEIRARQQQEQQQEGGEGAEAAAAGEANRGVAGLQEGAAVTENQESAGANAQGAAKTARDAITTQIIQPTLYQIICDDGAIVYENANILSEQIRTIPNRILIFVQERHNEYLHIPNDGWIHESNVQRVYELVQNEYGQWS